MSKASDLIFKIVIFHDVPQGPQNYTQGFPGLAEGGVGVFLKPNYAGWELAMRNIYSFVYKSISVLRTSL